MSTRVAATGSFDTLYGLWVRSWETALAALATATQTRILAPGTAAGHAAAIASERKVVVNELTLLSGQALAVGTEEPS